MLHYMRAKMLSRKNVRGDENGSFETLKTLFKKSISMRKRWISLAQCLSFGHPWSPCEESRNVLTNGRTSFNVGNRKSSNQIKKLGCNPVRDKVRLMASSGELDRDEDGCSTLLFDTNDDWLRRIVKQEQFDDESASFIDFEEPAFPPEDSPHVDDNLNLEENESDRVVESESVTPKPVTARGPLRSTRGKEETVEKEDPSRRSIKKRAGATSSRKLSKKVRKIKSNAEDSEESASDWNTTKHCTEWEVHTMQSCYLAFEDLATWKSTLRLHTLLKVYLDVTSALDFLTIKKCYPKHKGRIDRLRSCEICSASCCDLATLKQHIKYFHPEVFNPQEQERQEKIRQETLKRNKSYKVEVICEECGKVLTSTLGYKHHMELHRNPKSQDIIKCSVCEQDFMREQALKLHQCRHHAKELNLTPIPCPTCHNFIRIIRAFRAYKTCSRKDKVIVVAEFLRESQLSRHMLRHGERTVMCFQCPSSFWAAERELDVHVRRKHTPYDLRPHVCNVCQKRFSRSTLLRRHRRIHLVNSTYECKVCSHTFTQGNYLYCHVKRVHGQRLRTNELEDARVLTSNTASSSSLSTSIKEEAGAISTQTLSRSNDVDLTSQYTISLLIDIITLIVLSQFAPIYNSV
ncbi:Zinc finger and BTB domain-containing protein 41 [Orchesella cincta]|uniref:Zinc finger and BTB domain-containing protein 41 n=1 Tax=Orchesella cincta TaxID=48709 RepID=A0A1D2MC04_ORCCI|nr:Zinc finger and BTB domain-containing protein 41 [Orchesella cincta]